MTPRMSSREAALVLALRKAAVVVRLALASGVRPTMEREYGADVIGDCVQVLADADATLRPYVRDTP